MKQIVILGAGISGLAAAWFLKEHYGTGAHIRILEKSSRPGGYLQTVEEGGFLFDLGPRSCRTQGHGHTTLALIEKLGLQDELITPSRAAKKRYLWLHGRLQKTSSWGLPFTSLGMTLLQALMRDFRCKPLTLSDESIESFALRQFGTRATRELIDPLTSGIYAGDISKLSVRSCFPRLHQWQQSHGSVLRGAFRTRKEVRNESAFVTKAAKEPFFSFRRGMGTLTDTLAEKLADCLHYQCAASTLKIEGATASITTESGRIFHADTIISALPAAALAPLLKEHHPSLAQKLTMIKACPVATISLGYHTAELKHHGFGYLIPSQEREPCLGIIWDSSVFPQHNRTKTTTRLSVMIGGSRHPARIHEEDHTLKDLALDTVKRHLGITKFPDCQILHRHYDAIPQYTVGHNALVEAIETEATDLANLEILGNSFYGVSINECIAAAMERVKKITSYS